MDSGLSFGVTCARNFVKLYESLKKAYYTKLSSFDPKRTSEESGPIDLDYYLVHPKYLEPNGTINKECDIAVFMISEHMDVGNMVLKSLLKKDVPCEIEVCGYPKSGKGDMYMDKGQALNIDETPLKGYDFVFHDLITEPGCSGGPIVRFDEEEEVPMIVGLHTRAFSKINAGVKLSRDALQWIQYAASQMHKMHDAQEFPPIPECVEWSSGEVKPFE